MWKCAIRPFVLDSKLTNIGAFWQFDDVDRCWKSVQIVTQFWQRLHREGAPPRIATGPFIQGRRANSPTDAEQKAFEYFLK